MDLGWIPMVKFLLLNQFFFIIFFILFNVCLSVRLSVCLSVSIDSYVDWSTCDERIICSYTFVFSIPQESRWPSGRGQRQWWTLVGFPWFNSQQCFFSFISLGLRRYLTVTKIPELHSFSPIDFITSTEQWNQQWRSPDQACHNLYKLSMLSVCLSVCAYWIPTYSELRRTEPAKMDRTRPNRRYSFPPKWTEPAQTTLLPAKMD